MTFPQDKGTEITLAIVRAIRENRDYLSEVDGLIGDGDHGVNMNKGFSMYAEKIAGQKLGVSEAFKLLGRTLLGDIGGSMGPLYGTFFIEMSKKARGAEAIDAPLFAAMLGAARDGIFQLGGAKVGDKTLMDALVPAADGFAAAVAEGRRFDEALAAMKAAARAGRDSTRDLVAKIGRASRLGERSLGVLDAGAVSCCLILCAMADAIAPILE
ncbi:MAG: dihydroxyacetone kinase subunit L [Clostridiales bacterium]|nr:dihydroxyacetone kinase subunit L [Clostridiales bacterium]